MPGLFHRIFGPKPQPSPLEQAEQAAAVKLQTQRVRSIRDAKDALRRTATLNGLYAVAAPEVRERFDEVMSRRAGA